MRIRQSLSFSLAILFLILALTRLSGLASSSDDPYPWKINLPLVVKNYFPNWVWHEESSLTITPSPRNSPLLAIDQQGRPHILSDTWASGQQYIYHSYLGDAGWTPYLPIANTIGTSKTLFAPVIGANGHIILLWNNYLGASVEQPFRLMYSSFNGSSWGLEEEVIRDKVDILGWVRPDDQGNLHVTSTDTALGFRATFSTRTTTGWKFIALIDPDHTVRKFWPDMHGGVHFFGSIYDIPSDSYGVIYSYWQNGQFKVNGKIVDGSMGTRDSNLDGLNNLHLYAREQVAIPGDTVLGITHQCLDSSQNWGEKTVPSGQAEVDGPAQSGTDRTGLFALGWEEKISHDFRFGIWQGCTRLAAPNLVPFTQVDNFEVIAVAVSTQPQMFCMLIKEEYQYNYRVLCADF